MNKQRELYQISGSDSNNSQLNLILQRISERIDKMEGLKGNPKFYSSTFEFSDGVSGVLTGDGSEATFQTRGFIDRGDPSAFDFVVGDLTTDGNWHDLDLSSIIPVGAQSALLRVSVTDDAANSSIAFRENGNSNVYNDAIVSTQVSGVQIYGEIIVSCDSDGVVEYNATNTTFTTINILVRGWWI